MSLFAIAAAALIAAGMASEGQAVEAPGPSGALAGTLTGPGTADAPLVLIIPGSGPTDRDGNSPLGITAAPYRMLAEGLALRGITTVRADKRGMFGSKAAVADPNAVTIADYVEDVAAWSATLREKTGAQCLWLLGHSEGGLVALAAAGKVEGICGLLLVSAPGRPLADVIREQLRANPANAPVLPQAEAALAELEAGRKVSVEGMHPGLLPLFAPPVQGFLISLFSYDPAQLVAGADMPILVLQGERDIQVSTADARRLADASQRARLVLLPDVNHVLKRIDGDDRAANLAAYADSSLPVPNEVLDAIANFVREPRHDQPSK